MKKDDLNKKQRYALDTMLSGSNVFLTGDAGTGKTTVIQTFIDEAEKAGKSVLVSATIPVKEKYPVSAEMLIWMCSTRTIGEQHRKEKQKW